MVFLYTQLHQRGHDNMSSPQTLELRVGNLDCEHDAAAIERGLSGFTGLDTLKVYPKSAKVVITYDPAATTPNR